ncbi:hypothetical protein BTM25_47580 [Actinomadura rubteroloni]|uniref:DUF1684 domain-containing protein n=2 Tax=Actinomadura rubteroloni TaxID=1926885 RepID=A0A2P4UF09_9ACTN|nr:hypothetical protein BTM25_47580 [Actinomadura rubteroloni]
MHLKESIVSTDEDAWKLWHEERLRAVRAPLGALSITGTHWVADETRIPGVPGVWGPHEAGVRLKAVAADGIRAHGQVLEGVVVLEAGTPGLTVGDRTLAVLVRDGVPAVRVFDSAAANRLTFDGIETFDFDPAWTVAATFTPYDAERAATVPNADGVRRALVLAGDVAFELAGERRTLAVSRSAQGLSAVFGDAASGSSTFRFLDLPEPDAEGRTVVDFTRAYLPPCAFTDHSLCPFPPPGNVLDVPVTAGERSVRRV